VLASIDNVLPSVIVGWQGWRTQLCANVCPTIEAALGVLVLVCHGFLLFPLTIHYIGQPEDNLSFFLEIFYPQGIFDQITRLLVLDPESRAEA
jgi:hypothetical protein